MVPEGHFLVPHAGRALAFFSRKHFWHSLKKHFVGFKVGFENQSSFFSETSSLNPTNIQNLNRHLLPNVPGKDPHIYIPTYGCWMFAIDPIHKNERAFFKERFRVMMGLLWGSCTGILWLIFPRSNGHSLVTRVWMLQNGQGCQCTTTPGECRGGYLKHI